MFLAAALLPLMMGCNHEEKLPTDYDEERALSVNISFTGSYEPDTGGASPTIDKLTLLFVGDGIVEEVSEIPGSEITRGIVRRTFTGVSACVNELIVLANICASASSELPAIEAGSPVTDIGKIILHRRALDEADPYVPFYGAGTCTDVVREIFIHALPIASCIKIERIEALKEVPEDYTPLKSFKLAGIYMNNTYTSLGLDEESVPGKEDAALNFSSRSTKWVDGAYPASLGNEFHDGACAASFTPLPGTEWKYNLLPAKAGTVINNQKQGATPHIILKIESALSVEDTYLPSPSYVTIREITVDGKPVDRLERGKVYTVPSLSLAVQHLSPTPEAYATANLKAEALVSDWYTEKGTSPQASNVEPTANCYIIAPDVTDFLIPVSRANSDGMPRIGEEDSMVAELVWTDVAAPFTQGSAIRRLDVQGVGNKGFLCVSTGATEGNAVVAIKINNEIKWSWHIWVTTYQPSGKTGTFMDRNLGALSNERGHNNGAGTLGLLYQWGRKDPFPGSAAAGSEHEPLLYLPDGTTQVITVQMAPGGPNLEACITHPHVFYSGMEGNCDWYSYGNGQRNNFLWSSPSGRKTPYDPCPAGWKVPVMSDLDMLSGDNFLSKADFPKGRVSSKYGGWYPAAGYRNHTEGKLSGVGTEGMYWNASPFGAKARILYFYDHFFLPGNTTHRACALPVRCIRE